MNIPKNNPKNRRRLLSLAGFLLLAAALTFISLHSDADRPDALTEAEHTYSGEEAYDGPTSGEKRPSRREMNAMRADYFFRLLRDPATNAIPANIRNRELQHARQQPTRRQLPLRIRRKDGTMATMEYLWEQAGPKDVGGRSRALAIDRTNPGTVIAGGVSGGVWKSTDRGTTWQLATDPTQNQSVTSLAQDPTAPSTWYYSSGEFRGQSAADRGNTTFYWGDGVYKSTDNGESWTLLPNASSNEDYYVTKFNTISRVAVSPVTGSVFIASNGFGIYRSTDDGDSFSSSPLLGAEGEQYWADIAVAPDGRLLATLSTQTFENGAASYTPGVFVSADDGESWSDVTPATFPSSHERSVISFAPSAPDTAYVLTYVGGTGSGEDVRFHMIDLNSGGQADSEDRSQNLPDFGEPVGFMNTQQNYNMEVAIKPDDPDFVLVGGTNLFRSTDGFATPTSSADVDDIWVGGYNNANDIAQYSGHHADQHVVVFDPQNPDAAWSAHDGGLSYTEDITASPVTWNNRDGGYITSQFYGVDLPDTPGDNRLVGGTQDNGTPFFLAGESLAGASPSIDLTSGDGGYAFFSTSYIFTSRQEGDVIRYVSDSDGLPSRFAFVHPSEAANQFFIHPYAIDPNNETHMYYPEDRMIWRNTAIDEIPSNNDPEGVMTGWESFNAATGSGYSISALEVSTFPADILYYGASSNNGIPKIYRLEQASSTTDPVDISIPNAPEGAFVHNFGINPADGDEVIVVFSNYDIPSIYHTSDGGENWQNIEGNLSGANSAGKGPSVRSAAILPTDSGTIYLVGTSTGVYSTTSLDGASTQWVREADELLGSAVTDFISVKSSDGTVAAATHGRGIFLGHLQGEVTGIPRLTVEPASASPETEITLTATNFAFNASPTNNTVTFNGIEAEITGGGEQQLQVIVPRGTISPENANDRAEIRVQTGATTVNTLFRILAPETFKLHPNYPNPFNPSTTIPIDVPQESGIIIQVYDLSGRKVLEPVRKIYQANTYNIRIDLGDLASGIYFYRVLLVPQDESGDIRIKSGKMTLVK